MEWYFFASLSLIFFGIQKFLFKVSAEKRYASKNVTLYFMLSVTILALLGQYYLYPADPFSPQDILLYSSLNGTLFLLLTITRLAALKLVPSNIAIPLFDLSFIFMFPLSIWLFNDNFTHVQIIGVIIGIIAIIILLKKEQTEHKIYPHFIKGILYSLIALALAVALNVLTKYIAISEVNTLPFIALSYGLNTILLLISHLYRRIDMHINNLNKNMRGEVMLGIAIGFVNFIAFFSNLEALKTGSVALTGVMVSFSSVIALLLSVTLYKEKITFQRMLGLILTFISLALLK